MGLFSGYPRSEIVILFSEPSLVVFDCKTYLLFEIWHSTRQLVRLISNFNVHTSQQAQQLSENDGKRMEGVVP